MNANYKQRTPLENSQIPQKNWALVSNHSLRKTKSMATQLVRRGPKLFLLFENATEGKLWHHLSRKGGGDEFSAEPH